MMLTDLHGLDRIMECGDISVEIFIVGIAIGIVVCMIAYHFLKDMGPN